MLAEQRRTIRDLYDDADARRRRGSPTTARTSRASSPRRATPRAVSAARAHALRRAVPALPDLPARAAPDDARCSARRPTARRPALRNLRGSARRADAASSTTLGPFSEASRPGVPHARPTAARAAGRRSTRRAAARSAELARRRRAAARGREQPRDHARAPRRPASSRSRRTRARRAAARATPASRRSCATSSASRRRPTSSTPTATCSRSRRSSTTRARRTPTPQPPRTRRTQYCRAILGPSQPGIDQPDPTATPTARKARKRRRRRDAATPRPRRPAAPRRPTPGAEHAHARPELPAAARPTARRRAGQPTQPLLDYLLGHDARTAQSIIANPVLVGAVTLLVVIVAVFLAYNANNGLPFVPTHAAQGRRSPTARTCCPATRSARAATASASSTTCGRCGCRTATVGAEVDAEDRQGRRRRSRSTRRVDLGRARCSASSTSSSRAARASETFADGDTLPASPGALPGRARRVLQHLRRAHARRGSQRNLHGLRRRVRRARRVAEPRRSRRRRASCAHLEPVMRVAGATATRSSGASSSELGDAARDRRAGRRPLRARASPPAPTRSRRGRATPTALQRDDRASRRRRMDAGIRSFRVQRPFLRDFARLLGRARARRARAAAHAAADHAGARRPASRCCARSPEVNDELRETLDSLRRPDGATRHRHRAARPRPTRRTILNPLVRFVGPYITVCNYFNYALTHVGEHLTEPDPTGSSQRTLLNQAPRTRQPDRPARRRRLGAARARPTASRCSAARRSTCTPTTTRRRSTAQGNADCESGQRGYIAARSTRYGDARRQDRRRPAHAGQPGPDVHRPPARARGPDVHARARDRAARCPPELDP